jgi:ankyrin repeat protein
LIEAGYGFEQQKFKLFKLAIGSHYWVLGDGHCASEHRDTDVDFMHFLVEKGMSVHSLHNYDTKQTPMHFAFANGKIDAIDYLLAHGADINARDFLNCTPLDILLTRDFLGAEEKIEIVKRYIGQFDLSIASRYDGTAIKCAEKHCPELVGVLQQEQENREAAKLAAEQEAAAADEAQGGGTAEMDTHDVVSTLLRTEGPAAAEPDNAVDVVGIDSCNS